MKAPKGTQVLNDKMNNLQYVKEERTSEAIYEVFTKQKSPLKNKKYAVKVPTELRILKSATLKGLVQNLTNPKNGHIESYNLRVLIATYRTFTQSMSLLTCLIQRYKELSSAVDMGASIRSNHLNSLKTIILHWLTSQPNDFTGPQTTSTKSPIQTTLLTSEESILLPSRQMSPAKTILLEVLEDFIKEERGSEDHLVELICNQIEIIKNLSLPSNNKKSIEETRSVDSGIDSLYSIQDNFTLVDFPAKVVADTLTCTDVELFQKLEVYQCLGGARERNQKKLSSHSTASLSSTSSSSSLSSSSSNSSTSSSSSLSSQSSSSKSSSSTVKDTIDHFNSIVNYVISSILIASSSPPSSSSSSSSSYSSPSSSTSSSSSTAQHRALIVEKWIEVAKECRMLRNFSALKAIVSSLQSCSIYRLDLTWSLVKKEKLEVLEELEELVTEEDNQHTFRQLMENEVTAKSLISDASQFLSLPSSSYSSLSSSSSNFPSSSLLSSPLSPSADLSQALASSINSSATSNKRRFLKRFQCERSKVKVENQNTYVNDTTQLNSIPKNSNDNSTNNNLEYNGHVNPDVIHQMSAGLQDTTIKNTKSSKSSDSNSNTLPPFPSYNYYPHLAIDNNKIIKNNKNDIYKRKNNSIKKRNGLRMVGAAVNHHNPYNKNTLSIDEKDNENTQHNEHSLLNNNHNNTNNSIYNNTHNITNNNINNNTNNNTNNEKEELSKLEMNNDDANNPSFDRSLSTSSSSFLTSPPFSPLSNNTPPFFLSSQSFAPISILPSQNSSSSFYGTVPYLGIFLTDLSMLHAAYPDFVSVDHTSIQNDSDVEKNKETKIPLSKSLFSNVNSIENEATMTFKTSPTSNIFPATTLENNTNVKKWLNFSKKKKEWEVLARLQLYQTSLKVYNLHKSHLLLEHLSSLPFFDDKSSYTLSLKLESGLPSTTTPIPPSSSPLPSTQPTSNHFKSFFSNRLFSHTLSPSTPSSSSPSTLSSSLTSPPLTNCTENTPVFKLTPPTPTIPPNFSYSCFHPFSSSQFRLNAQKSSSKNERISTFGEIKLVSAMAIKQNERDSINKNSITDCIENNGKTLEKEADDEEEKGFDDDDDALNILDDSFEVNKGELKETEVGEEVKMNKTHLEKKNSEILISSRVKNSIKDNRTKNSSNIIFLKRTNMNINKTIVNTLTYNDNNNTFHDNDNNTPNDNNNNTPNDIKDERDEDNARLYRRYKRREMPAKCVLTTKL